MLITVCLVLESSVIDVAGTIFTVGRYIYLASTDRWALRGHGSRKTKKKEIQR